MKILIETQEETILKIATIEIKQSQVTKDNNMSMLYGNRLIRLEA